MVTQTDRQRLIQKLANLEAEQINGIEQRLLSVFKRARDIQKKADKKAKRIWRQVVIQAGRP